MAYRLGNLASHPPGPKPCSGNHTIGRIPFAKAVLLVGTGDCGQPARRYPPQVGQTQSPAIGIHHIAFEELVLAETAIGRRTRKECHHIEDVEQRPARAGELHDLVAHRSQLVHEARHVELLAAHHRDLIGKLVVSALELLRLVIAVRQFEKLPAPGVVPAP